MKESVLMSVEGRGVQFRPAGSGDYQPAVYNLVQATMLAGDMLREGHDPIIGVVVDLGLSPEEYSPTGKYIADRSRRVNGSVVPDGERIREDFRAGHSIAYGVGGGLDPEETNSAAHRTVGEVRDGLDISPAEAAIARRLFGRPYAELERALLDGLLLNAEFLAQILHSTDLAYDIRSRVRYCIHPVAGSPPGPVEQDYRAALEQYLSGNDQPVRQLLRAFGMSGQHAKGDSKDLSLKVPVDGHLTSYLAAERRNGNVVLMDRDRLGREGRSRTLSAERYLDAIDGPLQVLSYPVLEAEQLVNTGLAEYIPAPAGPRFETGISRIVVVAERTDPDRPAMDQMHAQVFSRLGKMAGVPIEVLSYPTDRLINPDTTGRRDLREVGLEVEARLQDFGEYGVPVPLDGKGGG